MPTTSESAEEVCTGEVEAESLNQHSEAHQETKCIAPPVIIDERFIDAVPSSDAPL